MAEDKRLDNIENNLLQELSSDEIAYTMTPIGGAILEKTVKRRKTKNNEKVVELKTNPKYNKVQCEICGKIYGKNNSSNHRKSVYHKSFEDINRKLLALLRPSLEVANAGSERYRHETAQLNGGKARCIKPIEIESNTLDNLQSSNLLPKVYDRIDDRAERSLESETDESSGEQSESDY